MMTNLGRGGIWSATPTPFTADRELDIRSIHRLVEHHVKIGVTGLMVGGTCGEGPWLRQRDREKLTKTVVQSAAGRLRIALQVTDNSPARVLDNIQLAAEWGVEIGVVEAPYYLLNATPQRKLRHYRTIAQKSPLPIGLYDRGDGSANSVPEPLLGELLAEPRIVMVKDSSRSPSRREIHLQARERRPELILLNGDEFDCVAYLEAGYDGLLLGGGIFNAPLARKIISSLRDGKRAEAENYQARLNDLMRRVYGQNTECWLAGLKELLVQMGIFTTNTHLLEYPLTDVCRAQIHAAVTDTDGLGFGSDLLPTENLVQG